jgi:hypothetical protein
MTEAEWWKVEGGRWDESARDKLKNQNLKKEEDVANKRCSERIVTCGCKETGGPK